MTNEAVRIVPGKLTLSGDGVFGTRQGEGITAGKEVVFVRTHLCNLACEWCDTSYTWDRTDQRFWTEPTKATYAEIAKTVKNIWQAKGQTPDLPRAVFSGGEPLIQQSGIAQVMALLPEYDFEVETNGTILPREQLVRKAQINCSPKLSGSGNPEQRRYRPQILREIAQLPNAWFKFVVSSIDEFTEVGQIAIECHIPADRILVMPEGRNATQIAAKLDQFQEEIDKRGWKSTKRFQLIWYGDTRRT